MVGLEGVLQAAGEAAGEGPRQPGASRLRHRVPVRCRARARRENARQGGAGGDPAGGNQRKVDPCADQAEQSKDPEVLVTVGVGEGTAVPARLDPLDDGRPPPPRPPAKPPADR